MKELKLFLELLKLINSRIEIINKVLKSSQDEIITNFYKGKLKAYQEILEELQK